MYAGGLLIPVADARQRAAGGSLFAGGDAAAPEASDAPAALAKHVRIARVAVERAFDAARDPGEGLAYRVPDDMPGVTLGVRATVPLGRATAQGLIAELGGPELAEGIPPAKLRSIKAVSGPALPADLVELARWLAAYYVCPLGTVAATMLPAAVKKGTGRRTKTVIDRAEPGDIASIMAAMDSSKPKLTPTVRAAWDALAPPAPMPDGLTAKELARHAGAKTVGPINKLVALGLLTERRMIHVASRTAAWETLNDSRDLVEHTPTGEQQQAIDRIAATLGTFAVHLLRGVTGSGKTEVYLSLIRAMVAQHDAGTALVLVPEIALTPQTVARFEARLADLGVAVLHSGLAAADRHRQWRSAAEGKVRVVIGTRSAVFAPLANLALVIVDEEHDHSYKQDQAPRYNGRDVAIKRAHLAGCPVLLGSATPSIESWHNATADPAPGRARYHLHRLNTRATGAAMPTVSIADLARERRHMKPDDAIGPTLDRALRETLEAGGQALLLLNRRGYAAMLACSDRSCGYIHHCDHCDAAMVLHRGSHLPRGTLVRCHHCSAEQLVPKQCPACAKALIKLGVGTQRLEDELERRYRESHGLVRDDTMRRVDADAMTHARHLHAVLRELSEGRVKVVLGTQMIAKGLDFPNVRLVGVVSADTALALPDFRAGERTFQLVSQVAGRSGRGEHPGRVVVQTFDARAEPITLAAEHDYEAFARQELRHRREAMLPPATRMARLVCRDEKYERAEQRALRLAVHLRGSADRGIIVQGPAPCVVARVADFHRVEVLVTAPAAGPMQRALASARVAGLLLADTHTAVDVDPLSLL